MAKTNIIDTYAARLLIVSFFLPQDWLPAAVMVASVYLVCRAVYAKQPVPKGDWWWALLLGGVFLLYVFALPLTSPAIRAGLVATCQNKVALLFMPFVFAIVGQRFRQLVMGQLLYFVYACFLSCLAANGAFVYHNYAHIIAGLPLSHVAYRVAFEQFTGIHPTYMGMMLCMSVSIILSVSRVGKSHQQLRSASLQYALVFILLLFLLALLAKSALIAMAIIFVHYAFTHRQEVMKHKWRLAAMAFSVVIACYLIPFTGQRIKEVFSYLGHGKPGNIADNSVYVRKLILDTDIGLLKHNWLSGVGPANVLHLLRQRYFFYSIAHAGNVGCYDPHNEYLDEWLGFGIIGIVVLLLVLGSHLLKALRTGNQLYLWCLIILATTFFTETVLSRQEGVLFYAIFTSMFFFLSRQSQASFPAKEEKG